MKNVRKKKIYFSPQQKEIAINILRVLALGTILLVGAVTPGALQLLEITRRRQRVIRRFQPKQAWDVIKKLQREKHITIGQEDNQNVIKITEKGKTEILKFDLEKMEIRKPDTWDGWWRMVIFDIPETKKEARDTLRFLLKRLEFYQLQKSVFVHPYECKKEIDFAKEIYEIRPYVTYLKAKDLDNENWLKIKFDLT